MGNLISLYVISYVSLCRILYDVVSKCYKESYEYCYRFGIEVYIGL